jgi:8-hydroxy-5-deazaflavin:NADPH oxidoreductase
MKTAIAGVGNIGAQVSSLTETCRRQKLAAELGARVTAMTIADAINKADVVILAIYFDVMKDLIAAFTTAVWREGSL